MDSIIKVLISSLAEVRDPRASRYSPIHSYELRYCRTIASLFSTLSCTRRLGENMAERNAVSVFYLIPHMSLQFSFSFIFIFQFKCVHYLFNNSTILFLENNGSLLL